MKKMICVIMLLSVTLASLFAQEKPKIAVVEFSTNLDTAKVKADAKTVRDLVESQLPTGKYTVITRDEIDKLLANQQIQASSISSSDNIRKLKLQNISYIVTGSVNAMDNDYAVTVKVLDVSTGEFSYMDNAFMGSSSRDLYNGINTFMTKFVAGVETKGGQLVQTGQQQSRVSYKIGDTGPGGGIVFSVEGNSGMEVSRMLGEYNWDDAIQAAKNYRGGNFTDWYLPSISELKMIFENLQKSGVVNLGTGDYWSSTRTSPHYKYNPNYFYFHDGGGVWSNGESTKYSVRAVRAF